MGTQGLVPRMIGTTVSHYRIVERLGGDRLDAEGTVHRARHPPGIPAPGISDHPNLTDCGHPGLGAGRKGHLSGQETDRVPQACRHGRLGATFHEVTSERDFALNDPGDFLRSTPFAGEKSNRGIGFL
jgi:hypothetical protein